MFLNPLFAPLWLCCVCDSIKTLFDSHPYTDLLPSVIKVLDTDVDWQTTNTTSPVNVCLCETGGHKQQPQVQVLLARHLLLAVEGKQV